MSFEKMQAVIQGILSSQQQFQSEMVELKAVADWALQTANRAAQVADSNGCAIQAMLDQAVPNRLLYEEPDFYL
jgi:hypothetical protein